MLLASNPAKLLVVIEMESENWVRKAVADRYRPLAMFGASLVRDAWNGRRGARRGVNGKVTLSLFPRIFLVGGLDARGLLVVNE